MASYSIQLSVEANVLEIDSGLHYRRYLRCLHRINVAICYRAIENSDSKLAEQSAFDAGYFRASQCGSLHTNGLCHACRPRGQ